MWRCTINTKSHVYSIQKHPSLVSQFFHPILFFRVVCSPPRRHPLLPPLSSEEPRRRNLPLQCQNAMSSSLPTSRSPLVAFPVTQQAIGKSTPSASAALRIPSSLNPHHSLPSSTMVIVDGLRVAIALSPSLITLGRKGVLNTSTSVESKEN